MSPLLVSGIVLGYFLVLIIISRITSRKADTQTFFTANRKSPWFMVAFGMVGATLSGVTFISVPGEVGNSAFSYLQFVLGNMLGYWLVAFILIPIYYKLNLISIYGFLKESLGSTGHKTGSFFFIVSKLIGAAFRLYLVAGVLQIAFFDAYHIPFWITVLVTITLIWVYTYKGGIKTIVWTDTLQTFFLVSAVVFSLVVISKRLDLGVNDFISSIRHHDYSTTFFWDWRSGDNFFKQFISGIFVTVVMVGMDQDMMQKNLTCKNRKEAQKNMLVFSLSFVVTVILFLGLGVLLYMYTEKMGIPVPEQTDDLYPQLALKYLGLPVGIAFLLGITAAAYSSADSALTSLTTAFSIDFLDIKRFDEKKQRKLKALLHLIFSLLLILVIVGFDAVKNESIVVAVFRVAGYTYGPILGFFVYGLYIKRPVREVFIPIVAVLSPGICYLVSIYSEQLFNGYQFGFELLIMNGGLTLLGLLAFSKQGSQKD